MPDSQTALVTGANRGLGLAFARQLAARGDRVLATCRRPGDADDLRALADEHDGQITILELDVADESSIAGAFDAAADEVDAVHLLVNNAGVNGDGRDSNFGDLTQEELLRVYRVNAAGPLLVTQAARELLKAAQGATVVNITSGLGSIENATNGSWHSYRASKAALNMVTRVLAADLEGDGVAVVSMNPGWVQTDMGGAHANLTPEASIGGMLEVIGGLTMDDSGSFQSWNGSAVPW